MTNAILPIAAPREYERRRVLRPRAETGPWVGPASLVLVDLVLATAAVLAVSAIAPAGNRLVWAAVVPLAWVIALKLSRVSEAGSLESLAQSARRVVRAGCTLALVGCAVTTVPGGWLTSGQALLLALICTSGSLATRAATWRVAGVRGVGGRARVVVIGDEEGRRDAVAALERRAGPALSVVAVRIDTGADAVAGPPGVTSVALPDVAAYAKRVGARSVVVMPGPGLDGTALRRLRWLVEGARLPLYVGTGLVGVASTRLDATDVGGLPLVRVHAARRSGARSVLLGAAGRCVAAVALLVFLPVIMLVSGAIRWESPGPALYRQQRVGQDGKLFTIYKLRTMADVSPSETELASDVDGALFKMRSDPRVTPLGRWLRKYSVDELPQLLNVALGDMRLVGPRPALPDEVAVYSEDMRRRLTVRPGITGLWQVSGRSDLPWEEAVRLDLHYVDNWSPALDLLILCRTVGAVLGHRGAY